ncbi:MAG: DUF1850 domain-containing protein [Bacillota bacterium]|nr:DUF1850 domain-containing protein [Bacillota bacterium]
MPAVPQLSVTNGDSGAVLLSYAVEPGDTFVVGYIHSVNKSLVEDHFVITEDHRIMVESTSFVAYGAGIPEPEEGQTLTITEDAVVIDGIDRLADPYRLFVGVIADHRFSMGSGDSIHLKDLVPPQTTLIFQVERQPLWQLLTTKP